MSLWTMGSRCAGEGVVNRGYGIVVVQKEGMGWGWGGGVWLVYRMYLKTSIFYILDYLDLQLLNNTYFYSREIVLVLGCGYVENFDYVVVS